MIHASQVGAVGQVELALADAKKADKFMVVIWRVEESGELVCRRTTWQFPTARLMEAVQQLDNMIGEELHPSRTPLPLAKFLRPISDDVKERVFSSVGVPPDVFRGEDRPIEQDELFEDREDVPAPIVNAVMPPDPEDAE